MFLKQLTALLLVTTALCGASITGSIDSGQTDDLERIYGTITIRHQADENIDESSFKLDGKLLETTFIHKTPSTSDTFDSRYRFSIQNPGKGLQLLAPIAVKVNQEEITSYGSSYEISSTDSSQPVKLKGNLLYDGTLYPGQYAKAVYKIFYRGDVQLSEEELPILEPRGFIQIGRIEVKSYTEGDYQVQEISQQLQAERPGTYAYGPSVLEGIVRNREGKTTRINIEIPPIKTTIHPFPVEGRPESFNGALGNYTVEMTLLSPSSIARGDALKIELRFTGDGPLNTISLPDISCQPGFSGFFEVSSLPPTIDTENGVRRIQTEIRPLSSAISKIPPIYFSFFNPSKKQYTILKTAPLPIRVHALFSETPPADVIPSPSKAGDEEETPSQDDKIKEATPFEDKLIPLSASDLEDSKPSIWTAALAIPAALAFLGLQWLMLKYSHVLKKAKSAPASKDILNKAKALQHDPSRCFHLIEKAVIRRLQEQGQVPDTTHTLSDIIHYRRFEEAYHFLKDLEKSRYGASEYLSTKEACYRASRLLKSISRREKS